MTGIVLLLQSMQTSYIPCDVVEGNAKLAARLYQDHLYCRYVYINLVAKLVDIEMEILYYSYLHIGF